MPVNKVCFQCLCSCVHPSVCVSAFLVPACVSEGVVSGLLFAGGGRAVAVILGGLLTQGPAWAPAGVIIEKTGLLRVSAEASRLGTFGWNVFTLYYPTHSENVIQYSFKKKKHLQLLVKEPWEYHFTMPSWKIKSFTFLETCRIMKVQDGAQEVSPRLPYANSSLVILLSSRLKKAHWR